MFPLGEIPASTTLYLPFDTYNASGASVTITGLAVTDIDIYKNGSTTQRASDNGYALLDTDGIDFDGSTGLHGFSIDLADNSDAGFYVAGGQYWVHVNAITVDSQTVKFTYYFRIRAAESVAGTPKVDVTHFGGSAGTFGAGRPEVNTSHFGGTAGTFSGGRPEVNVSHFGGTAGTFASGRPEVNASHISGSSTAADNVEANIGNLDAAVSTRATPAQVNSEVDTALADIRLDELLAADSDIDGAAPPAVGSVFFELLTKTTGSFTYDQTTDSLEALRDNVGTTGAALVLAKTTNITGFNDLSAAQVNAEADAALVDVNLDHLVGTATAIPAVPAGTFLDQIMDDGTATYDRTTDSLQAIRDRGDAAWTTGGGGSITDLLNVVPQIPTSIDLANTATWRIGLLLTNALDDLPSTAEITPGTISIDRKAIGGTSWTAIVTDAACSESAGLIFFDEVFDAGTGYAEGDSLRITFKSQKITVSAKDFEISDSTGRIFYTEIRQTERGTNSAALASEWTAARAAKLDEITAARLSELDDGAGKLVNDVATVLLTDRLTATRAALLDKLNITGNVAGSQEVLAIQNNTRVVRSVPAVIERPDSGTQTYRIELLLYDDVGNMEAPDSAPTIELVNQAGTDRSARLDSATMALVETGRYRAIYTASVGDALEQLKWTFSVVEGGATRKYGNDSLIVDTTAVDFTAADRAKLDTLHDTRLTAARAANLDNLDATVSTRATQASVDVIDDFLDTEVAAILVAVDTEVAAIKAKTDALPASPAATGDAMTLTAGERNAVADAYLDRADAIETGITPRLCSRYIAAATAGLLSGAQTNTEVFKGVGQGAGGTTRITATVDADGNRSAITLA